MLRRPLHIVALALAVAVVGGRATHLVRARSRVGVRDRAGVRRAAHLVRVRARVRVRDRAGVRRATRLVMVRARVGGRAGVSTWSCSASGVITR